MTRVMSVYDSLQGYSNPGRATIVSMKTKVVDAGLLAVFRLFTAIRLVLASGGMLLGILGVFQGHFQSVSWFNVLESSLLLLYLSWKWAQSRLGRWYLPVALTAATLGPIIGALPIANANLPTEINIARSMLSQWQLVIVLLLPLILISWQYSLSAAVGYTLILVILDYVVMVVLPIPSIILIPLALSISLFRTLFFLLIGYTIHRLAQELRQQNASLEQANRRLASFALTTEQLAISRERNRLARELHDTQAHTLSGLAVQLEATQALWEAQPDRAQHTIQEALSQTRQGLSDTRRAIQALRASPLEDLGLSMALEQLARNLADREGLQINLDLPAAVPELPAEVEHSFYRVAEEALRNVGQHAGAKTVCLALQQLANQIGLLVSDDGAGFDPEEPLAEDRFGLLGMQERAQSVGGRLQVQSQPGKGTTVQFWVEV